MGEGNNLFVVLKPLRTGTVPFKWDSHLASLQFRMVGRFPFKGNGACVEGSIIRKNLVFAASKLFTCLIILSLSAPPLLFSQSWTKTLEGIGTFSSARISDLNQDGVGDIILGAGRAEFQRCDSAVFALDGATGKMLWKVSAHDQMFGSANLKDINGDGVDDVFINGRSAELKAISGKDGKLIWEFYTPQEGEKAADAGWYNFYNPQFIPDQNGDDIEELLVSNGGNVLAEPYDPNRPAGQLLVIDPTNGKLLAKAMMPDGKEIYMSVAVRLSDHDPMVVFGTGGETIGGNLFVVNLSAVMGEDLSGARKLATSENKGFIAPPVWVDLTKDGIHDLVVNAVDGRMLAFDGETFEPLWTAVMPNTEAYTSLGVGNFTADSIPDLFASVARGIWPKLEWNHQFMVNGANGEIEWQDSLGFYQTSSPVAGDLTGDGMDEIVLSVNFQVLNEYMQKTFFNTLVIVNFSTGEVIKPLAEFEGNNISSTPWIGDLDDNGKLDIIWLHGTNRKQTYTFDGMKVRRMATDVKMYGPIKWGSYMGSRYDGVFED